MMTPLLSPVVPDENRINAAPISRQRTFNASPEALNTHRNISSIPFDPSSPFIGGRLTCVSTPATSIRSIVSTISSSVSESASGTTAAPVSKSASAPMT